MFRAVSLGIGFDPTFVFLTGRGLYNKHQNNVTPKQQAHAANDETPRYLTRAANFAVGLPNDFARLDCLDNCDK